MNVRQFKLVNAVGAEWDLMRKDAYFNSPSGLGMAKTFTTARTGYEFLILQELLSQKSVSGEMVFRQYSTYEEFVSFITQTPLMLHYMPITKWYRIRCDVQSLSKTEKSGPNLICPITFLCFGTWHEGVVVTQAEGPEVGQKKYTYSYPYTYAETSAGSALIQNGDLESPCKLHIFGPVTNPSWALYKAGEKVMEGKVNATIPDGNKLVVDADPATMEIAEYTRNNVFVEDLYQDSDFSTARFVYAPPGTSTITFTHEGTADINAYVEVEKLAYTV